MTSGITAVAVVEMMERNANVMAKPAGTRNSLVTVFISAAP
jgi:hypothetical protein